MNQLLSFVILTWNSERTIYDCLKSVSAKCNKEKLEYEIYIVDNGSSDETIKIISDSFKRLPIELIALDKNKGTTGPRNMALSKCKGNIICVLDSDAIFTDGSVKKIIELLDYESMGIVSPRLILPDGTIQNSVKKFPSVLSKFMKIPKIILKIGIKDYDFYDNFPFSKVTEVDTAISACWFFRRELLDDVGFLDEKIFYSPEDVDFCLRVRKAGKKNIYYPYLTILHHTQQITHKKFMSKVALSHLWGLIYFFWKHKYVHRPNI